MADSSALIGFGLDSVIEDASAVALSWQFSAKDSERREHLTLRIIAFSFFALALFVSVDSVRSLTGSREAQHSLRASFPAALSLAIMPVLPGFNAGPAENKTARWQIPKQTLLCTYLFAVLLVGLVLNSTLGWWRADAGAALVIAGIAARRHQCMERRRLLRRCRMSGEGTTGRLTIAAPPPNPAPAQMTKSDRSIRACNQLRIRMLGKVRLPAAARAADAV